MEPSPSSLAPSSSKGELLNPEPLWQLEFGSCWQRMRSSLDESHATVTSNPRDMILDLSHLTGESSCCSESSSDVDSSDRRPSASSFIPSASGQSIVLPLPPSAVRSLRNRNAGRKDLFLRNEIPRQRMRTARRPTSLTGKFKCWPTSPWTWRIRRRRRRTKRIHRSSRPELKRRAAACDADSSERPHPARPRRAAAPLGPRK